MLVEKRNTAQPVEFRAAGDGSGNVLTGYAATYNRYSQNLGGFVEQVAPGAFAKSLGDKVAVVARYNHDDNYLLGTTEAGTLLLESDDTGLRYDVSLPDTTAGNDVGKLAARGDLRYSSFAFHVLEDEWSVTEQGFPLRTLLNVQLVDVAPVNSPAYLDTSTGLRSLAEHLHMDVAQVEAAPLEEIRSLLNGEPATPIVPHAEKRGDEQDDKDGQGDTHPLVGLRQRQLELLNLK